MLDLIFYYSITAALFTFGKQALVDTPPFFLSAIHLFPAGIILLLWSYVTKLKNSFMDIKQAFPLFALATILCYLNDNSLFIALKKIPASHAALIATLTPFIAALIAYIFFKEEFTVKKTIALFLGFFGVLPLILVNILQGGSTGSITGLLVGYGIMFVNVASWVILTFIFKQLFAYQYRISTVLGIPFFLGGFFSLITSLFVERSQPFSLEQIQGPLGLTFLLFVVHNVIAPLLYGYLIKKYPVTLLTFACLTTPIISAALEFLLYRQAIGYTFLFSLVVLVVSFYLFFSEEKKEHLVQ